MAREEGAFAGLAAGALGPVGARVRREAFHEVRAGRPVEPGTIAERLGVPVGEVREALTALADRGLAELDGSGRVVGVGGLSVRPTRHRLTLEGTELWTWCAADAVGIPAALGADARAVTSCPTCGRELRVEMPGGVAVAGPELRVWIPRADRVASVADEVCPEVNLFCDETHLGAWRTARGDPPGAGRTVDEVQEIAKRLWRDLR
jgi:alkylmercury lyase